MRWIMLNMPFAIFFVAVAAALATMWVLQGKRRERVPVAVYFSDEQSGSTRH